VTGDLGGCTPRSFTFGPFVLVPERQLLLQGEIPLRIGGRALDILTCLVERAGEAVSKRELILRVWPNTIVEESNLKVNMAGLRRALGEGPGGGRYIATVVGRGYRFVAAVQAFGPVDASSMAANASMPAPIPVSPSCHNLPTASTRIFGRAEAIDSIQRDLDESRLVSIVGAGGIGKTTVALVVAEHVMGSFRDGVWLVDLSPLKDPSLVPNAIATAIGLAAHSANMLAALCEFLRVRQTLIVLDSCEHLIDAVSSCANRILAEAPRAKILVTTREPLRVKGERVRRLPGLDTPPVSSGLTAEEALAFPAVQLFVDRATERLESFHLDDADASTVAEICRKLDGLALAIELAATRVDAFGVRELLTQLGDRLTLLEGHRASAARHRTLTAAIDWSYELLPESERTLMRRLATFAGAFSLASTCAVAADDRIDPSGVVEGLANLVAKSLVAVEAGDVEVEYRQLDTTRSYALEKLTANGELESARRRHAEHFLDLAQRAGPECDRLPRTEWLARYGSRIDDIRDALRWAFTADAQLGVRLTVAAIPFWKQLSLVEECRAVVERALDDRFSEHRSVRDELTLNLTLGATLLHTRGPLLRVKLSLTKALEIAKESGDTDRQLEALRGLSEYELWTGDSNSALAVVAEIRAIATQGHVTAAADADAQAGSVLSYVGDLAASRRHLENIVERPVPHNLRSDAARFEFDQRLTARGSLAAVLWLQGFPDQAVELARRQREETEGSQYAVSLCYALLHCSIVISLYVHDLEAAGRFLDLAEAHATEHGLTVWRAMATCSRGRWLLNSGKPFNTAAYRNALAELYENGFRMRYANYLTNYGEALAREGDFKSAHAYIDEAIAFSRSRGQVLGVPEMLRIKGDVFRAEGSSGVKQAADCYLQSIEWARNQGALSWELRTAISQVELSRACGGNEQAEEMLASSYGRFREGFWTGDLQRARSLLGLDVPKP
jgi:predicted ATPase/DNA-binding winged helix-turn-helix (wHTH) protein